MSTTLVKPAEVERKWYLLDAAGKSLGHVAAEASAPKSTITPMASSSLEARCWEESCV